MYVSFSNAIQTLGNSIFWSVQLLWAIVLIRAWIVFVSQLWKSFRTKATTYDCYSITGLEMEQDDEECKACGRKIYVGFRKACPHCGLDPKRQPTKEELEKFNRNVIRRKPKEGQ